MSDVKLREALELADAALSGANMNMNVVKKKVKEALAQPAEAVELTDSERRFMVFNIGCIECGISSAVVGLYGTEEEADKVAQTLQECHDWRDGGQNSYQVFDLSEDAHAEYAEAIAAHEAKRIQS